MVLRDILLGLHDLCRKLAFAVLVRWGSCGVACAGNCFPTYSAKQPAPNSLRTCSDEHLQSLVVEQNNAEIPTGRLRKCSGAFGVGDFPTQQTAAMGDGRQHASPPHIMQTAVSFPWFAPETDAHNERCVEMLRTMQSYMSDMLESIKTCLCVVCNWPVITVAGTST